MVLAVDKDKGRLSLTTKKLEPSPGDMLRNRAQVMEKAEDMAMLFRKRMAAAEAAVTQSGSTSACQDGQPLARIGLIADIQHADIADARSDYGRTRYYRDALQKCRLAAEDWTAEGCLLAVNLGDTVDRRAEDGAKAALDRVLSALQPFKQLVHVMGNHDLSALPSEDWDRLQSCKHLSGLEVEQGNGEYRDVRISTGWRMILLDTYDVSIKRCREQGRQMRKNLLKEAQARRENCPYLNQHEELNGGVGPEQLQWLTSRLQAAQGAGDHAVVLTHSPLRPEPTYYRDAVCWNWQEVDTVLNSFPTVVAAVITGHDHHGGQTTSDAGVFHCVVEAAMEGEANEPAHGILDLYPNGLSLRGKGHVQSWERTF